MLKWFANANTEKKTRGVVCTSNTLTAFRMTVSFDTAKQHRAILLTFSLFSVNQLYRRRTQHAISFEYMNITKTLMRFDALKFSSEASMENF